MRFGSECVALIARLQDWYDRHRRSGKPAGEAIAIEALDDPAWKLAIDLSATDRGAVVAPRRLIERSTTDWILTEAAGGKFLGFGGPRNLAELVGAFFATVDTHRPRLVLVAGRDVDAPSSARPVFSWSRSR